MKHVIFAILTVLGFFAIAVACVGGFVLLMQGLFGLSLWVFLGSVFVIFVAAIAINDYIGEKNGI